MIRERIPVALVREWVRQMQYEAVEIEKTRRWGRIRRRRADVHGGLASLVARLEAYERDPGAPE